MQPETGLNSGTIDDALESFDPPGTRMNSMPQNCLP